MRQPNCSSPRRASVEQARQYVICEQEQGDGHHALWLVTNVKVQVAPVSHPPNKATIEMIAATIDPREPVWTFAVVSRVTGVTHWTPDSGERFCPHAQLLGD